ncbi:hypothetical protein HZH66_013665 [Vespula vulgaris]|uniref:Uncharacterized protein n=1 Tax=Vespula vulgaris TaxID=7454 RepID=A0A834MTD4_VESVU|nr:hypothetical protein HZH66_013665 [Vespula vulgaris]
MFNMMTFHNIDDNVGHLKCDSIRQDNKAELADYLKRRCMQSNTNSSSHDHVLREQCLKKCGKKLYYLTRNLSLITT